MIKEKPGLNDIIKTVVGWLPSLTKEEQSVSIKLYRMLAEGEPVALKDVVDSLAMPVGRVKEVVGNWPGVFYDDDGGIIGYWGLATTKTGHEFKVDGKTLYTWCAWDALFIPELLGKVAKVESTCPTTKETIHLTVTPNGVEDIEPKETVVSFLIPDEQKANENVVASFCHFVHFFSSEDAAAKWIASHPGTFAMSLDEAFELGKKINVHRY